MMKRISWTKNLLSFKFPAIHAWCLEKWNFARQVCLISLISLSWVLHVSIAAPIPLKPKITAKFLSKHFKSHSKSILMMILRETCLRVKPAKSSFLNLNLSLITVLWAVSILQLKVCCKRFMSTWVEGINFAMWMVSFLAKWRLSLMICCRWKMEKSLSQLRSSILFQAHFCKIHIILRKIKRQRGLQDQEMKRKMIFWDSKVWMSTITNEKAKNMI